MRNTMFLVTAAAFALAVPRLACAVDAPTADPVLSLADRQTDEARLRDAIRATILRHPSTTESEALEDEAGAGVAGAKERLLPRVDTSVSSYRVISRNFSNDPFNIIERSRARNRTDALLSAQQTLFDFGAGRKTVRAAVARYRSAAADSEANADRVAVAAIAAWYDVFGYRALVGLSTAFLADQKGVLGGMQERIQQGVAAESDLAQVDSAIARASTRLAGFQRGLANAEARFLELTGAPAAPLLDRAPVPRALSRDRDEAAALGAKIPTVRSADAAAEAAVEDARATSASRKPLLTAGVDAGRYGVVENKGDYDVRGTVTVRQRFFGGANADIHQAEARGRAAEARADRVREEASRDAAIAWADVQALDAQLTSLDGAYVAAKRSRDATLERFGASRGSLYDVLNAQESYYGGATAYIQGLIDLDAARYVLLSRTGKLLPELGIDASTLRDPQ